MELSFEAGDVHSHENNAVWGSEQRISEMIMRSCASDVCKSGGFVLGSTDACALRCIHKMNRVYSRNDR